MSGKKIIDGLKDAVAYAKGDKSRGRETVVIISNSGPKTIARSETLTKAPLTLVSNKVPDES